MPIVDEAARHRRSSARAGIKAAEAKLAAEHLKLDLRRALATIEVERNRHVAQSERQKVALRAELAALARARLEAGMASIADVYESTAREKSAEADAIEADRRLRDAYVNLSLVGGHSVTPRVEGKRTDWISNHFVSVSDIARCAMRHPDLIALEHEVAQKDYRVRASRAAHLPTIQLEAGYRVATSWSPGMGRKPAATRFNGRGTPFIAITMKLPIFGKTIASASTRRSIAERDGKVSEAEAARRAANRTALAAYRAVASSKRGLDATWLALSAANVSVDLLMHGVQLGTRDTRSVLDAMDRLSQARVNHVNARYDAAANEVKLMNLMGLSSHEKLPDGRCGHPG
jgi:Outer membrane protein